MAIGDFFSRLGGRSEEPAPEPEPQRPPTGDALREALAETERLVADGGVPSPVTARVLRVTGTVRDTIPRLDALGAGSDRAYAVMATATDYLPEAVGGYLRLPRRFADSRPVDGPKTALMVLMDQLDLLGATMDAVFDAVCRDDANALVAHGRFLSEKFGSRSRGGDLEVTGLPTTSPEAMAAAATWGEAAGPTTAGEPAAVTGSDRSGEAVQAQRSEGGDQPAENGFSDGPAGPASRLEPLEPDAAKEPLQEPDAAQEQPPERDAEDTASTPEAQDPRIDRLRPPSSLDL